MRIIFLLLVLLLALVVKSQDVSVGHQNTVILTLIAVDWLQTQQVTSSIGIYEMNPMLGSKPSIGKVNRYFALSVATYLLTQQILPDKMASTYRKLYIQLEFSCVANNYGVGIRF